MANETFTVTETIGLAPGGDTDLDTVIDPGETVRITVHITNNSTNPGETVATGLQFSQILAGMTLVNQAGNDVNVSPIAFNDSYNAVGNTLLEVGNATSQTAPQASVAGHVTDNDLEFFGDTFTVSAVQAQTSIVGNMITATTTGGGTVSIVTSGADMGSFTYMSAVNFTGADTFTYTIRDKGLDGNANTADDLVSTATVTINVANQVWYVDTGFVGVSNGTSTNPFTSLASVSGGADADDAGDYIYLKGSDTSGAVLETGQQLVGTGTALVVGGYTLATAGAQSTITHGAGAGVTLASGNTVTGLNIVGTDNAGVGITDGAGTVGSLTVSNVGISGQGQIIDIDQGGTLAVTLNSAASTGSTGANGGVIDLGGTGTLTGTFTVNGATSITGTHAQSGIDIGAASTNLASTFTGGTTISTTTSAGVNLGTNAGSTTFTDLDVTTTTGNALVANGAGTLIVTGSDNDFSTTTGQLVSLTSTAVGAGNLTFDTLAASGTVTGNAVDINGLTGGSLTVTGGTTIAGSSGDAINIRGGSTTNFAFNGITDVNGAATEGVELNGANGTVSFANLQVDAVGGAGLLINGNTNSVTVSAGAIGASDDPASDALNVTNGNGAISIAASLAKNGGSGSTGGNLVEITGRTGGTIDVTGALNDTSTYASSNNNAGLYVHDNTGGTFNFSNASKVLNTGSNAGVLLANNTGATINVTGGNLDVDTTTGAGFAATGGGTVNVTGSTNSINSVSATALNVSGTTIGGSGLTFQRIDSGNSTAAADPANGIVLNGTGTSGGLTVTGDGGGANNGSGGTIQSATGDGILLTNTENVRLGYMNISNNLGDGIGGSGVNGMVFNRLNISGNGNDAATDESGINLTQVTGSASSGSRPTSISNSVISNNNEFEIQIANSSGTLTNFQFINNTVSSNGSPINGNATSPHGNLFNFLGTGTSNMGLTVTGGTFTGNTPNPASPPPTIVGTGVNASSGGTSMTANVAGATFTNTNVGVDVSTSNASTNLTFDINGNTFLGTRAQAINSFHNGNAPFTRTVNGTIQNNIIGNATANSGSYLGRGIDIGNEGAINMTLRISGNTIQNVRSFEAIAVVVGLGGQATGGGTTNLTITNNAISNIMGSRGLLVDDAQVTNIASPPGAGPFPTIFANISGNTFGGTIAGQAGNGQFMRLDQDYGTFRVTQAQATAGSGGTELDNANGFTDPLKISIGGTVTYNQGTPPLPTTNPLPLLAVDDTAPSGDQGTGNDPSGTGGDPVVDPTQPDDEPAGYAGDPGGDATVPPPADPVPDASVILDDGFLSQAELAFFVDAARQRWAAAGLTPEQAAALDSLTFSVVDMPGQWLGSFNNGAVSLDSDGAGRGWFADTTPLEDSEFANAVSDTRLVATLGTPAAGRFDLLTTILHEMGHALGLGDLYDAAARDNLLYGYLFAGERRLPGNEADGATPGTITQEAYAGSVIQVVPADGTGGQFNLPPGRSVDIQWDATIDLQTNQLIVNPVNSGTVSATNAGAFPDVTSNVVTTALDTLTAGGTVWFDNGAGGGVAGNGIKEGTEPGVDGVTMALFVDADNNDVPDTPGTALLTATTSGGGNYSFTGLAPGNYIVRVDAGNFTGGGALVNRATTVGELDPDNNTDNDDNGYLSGGAVFGHTITLAYNTEPTNGSGNDTNLTLDFGFAVANQLPVFTGLDGTPSFTEGGAAAVLDSNATVSDPDLTGSNYAGATLTLARSGGADAADLFGTSGTLTFSGTDVLVGAVTIGTFTQSAGTLVITFTTNATQALLNSALQQLTYSNTSDNPPASAAIAFTFNDGNSGSQGIGGAGVATGSVTVSITGVDDAGVAVNDPGNSTAENATKNVAVLANDVDPDNAPSVSEVDGAAIAVGGTVTLASGATVKLEANGTLTYDPNGKFNYLISTATQIATQAVNTSATDDFTYKLAGGSTATVGMTVTGVDSAGDQLWGDSGNNTITWTGSSILFNLGQGGDDTATGGNSNDGFYMGAALNALDVINGGGGSDDQLGLQGNYGSFLPLPGTPFVLAATHLVNIETLVFLPGNDARFGDTSGASYSYNVATIDDNVGAGQKLTVNFNSLRSGENVIFDGSLESDGWFFTFGGLGNDAITGGDQNDGFYFGNNGRWGAGDSVDGGAGSDQLGLQGSYTVVFGAGQLTGIETIALLTGGDVRFGNPAGVGYSYGLTMDDGNVATGATLIVNANTLRAGIVGVSDETLTFDGSNESDGHFTIYSGAGNDTLTGGDLGDTIYGAGGADTLAGGLGNDSFAYMSAAHSTATAMDHITDFTAGDLINLSSIDAVTGGANDAFSFIGTAAFSNTAGQLRFEAAGADWLVQGDIDGNGTADFQLLLTLTDAHPITASDFVL